MTIKQARKLLGNKSLDQSDSEIQEMINTGQLLADLIIDQYLKMTPQERKDWHSKYKDS